MNDLRRELAPLTDGAWTEIEEEARSTLKTYLAARKLVDVVGPEGWEHSAVNLGRAQTLDQSPAEEVETRQRRVQALLELRAAFQLERDELDSIARGAKDADLDPLLAAARQIALAEDRIVFHGMEVAAVSGICPDCPHEPIGSEGGVADYPRLVSEGINRLRQTGVAGPYALALSPAAFTELAETAGDGGYPVINHVRRIIEGPIVWAPALEGAVVMSLRGGDFELTLGRDISIGYLTHDAERVTLYLEESLTFRTLTPEAAVRLRPMKGG